MTAQKRLSLGDLERSVLDALWSEAAALSVRDVQRSIARRPGLAYTTVMTVLDRLHDKGFVSRRKDGRAFVYRPRITHAEWLGERAARVLASEAAGDRAVLAAFLDSTDRVDPDLLNELSDLIDERRKREGARRGKRTKT
jgi:predicted transcriptional regulator